jgi:AGZA family xanthine/uracil permease-like MFS transporter
MISDYFKLKESGTNIHTEVIGGITTFMAMSYSLFVQPAVLSATGMDFGAVMVATCLASALATFLMGIFANLPVSLAPAMGHNFFFVYNICGSMGIPWQVALGANFISSAITTVFVWLREKIVYAVPESLKHAIAVGIGLLITLIGFEWAGIIDYHPGTLLGLGDFSQPAVWLSFIGLIIIIVLLGVNAKGPLFWGIIATALLGIPFGVVKFEGLVSAPPSILPTLLQLNIKGALRLELISAIFILFFLDLFDSVGTLIGVGKQGNFIKKDGQFPHIKEALTVDAASSLVGTALGTTTITSYIESSAGIAQGAKTGLSNMVTAFLFLISIFFFPFVRMIGGGYTTAKGIVLYPAIAPALIIVGSFMLKNVKEVNWDDISESIPAFLTMVIMPFTFSITEGIAFGFITYSLLKLVGGKAKDVHWLIYLFSGLFLLRYIFLKG